MNLNNEDIKIINVLKKDSSLSIRKIASMTNIPVTTVHSHIRKLRKQGIIKRYTVELDMAKLGKPISAVILLNVNPAYLQKHSTNQESIAGELIKHELVEKAISITGRYDFMLVVRAKDIDEINKYLMNVLRRHEAIQRSETFVELYEAEKGIENNVLKEE